MENSLVDFGSELGGDLEQLGQFGLGQAEHGCFVDDRTDLADLGYVLLVESNQAWFLVSEGVLQHYGEGMIIPFAEGDFEFEELQQLLLQEVELGQAKEAHQGHVLVGEVEVTIHFVCNREASYYNSKITKLGGARDLDINKSEE